MTDKLISLVTDNRDKTAAQDNPGLCAIDKKGTLNGTDLTAASVMRRELKDCVFNRWKITLR